MKRTSKWKCLKKIWQRGWDSNLRRFAGVRARSRNPGATGTTVILAERVGFEPTVGVNLHTLSKRAP
jgi:hypothetical protein